MIAAVVKEKKPRIKKASVVATTTATTPTAKATKATKAVVAPSTTPISNNTNQAFVIMAERIVRRQNLQLLKIIAKNEDLDYNELVAKYIS